MCVSRHRMELDPCPPSATSGGSKPGSQSRRYRGRSSSRCGTGLPQVEGAICTEGPWSEVDGEGSCVG